MAPRNNEADTSYQKSGCSSDRGMDIEATLPCLMHKKHKVVKLVKSQLLKIKQEGLLEGIGGSETFLSEAEVLARADFASPEPSKRSRLPRMTEMGEPDPGTRRSEVAKMSFFCYLLSLLLAILLLILLIVWISAGPLSNSMAHTPISPTAFVRTDSICSLEKKYLLRWSKSQSFE